MNDANTPNSNSVHDKKEFLFLFRSTNEIGLKAKFLVRLAGSFVDMNATKVRQLN